MATVKDVYRFIDKIAPFETQMSFDNSGFLVGRGDALVERILVALDITEEVVEEAVQQDCQLIVSHHPVIFHPARSITDESVNGRILLALTENRVAAVCAHTNLDAAQGGVNCCLAQRLKLKDIEQLHVDGVDGQGREYGIGRVGRVHEEVMDAETYAGFVKEALGAASVRFADGGKRVSRVAVGGGSCGSMLMDAAAAGCDTFITADVKYDQYLEAKAMGITLMDAGHYATEQVVCEPLADMLSKEFPQIEVLTTKCHKEVYGSV